MSQDYASANACHGCPDGASSLQSDGLLCMKALNKPIAFASTTRYATARINAFEACRYYGLFAISWSSSYTDPTQQATDDDFALAKSQLATARKHARSAITILGLRTYP
jgi:hypothetical protein